MRKVVMVSCILSFLVGMVFLKAPVVSNIQKSNLEPFQSTEHVLGTDRLGRDILSLLCFGGVGSFLIAVPARILNILISLCFSFLGFFGGSLMKSVITFLQTFTLSLPSFLTAFLFISVFGSNFFILIFILAFSDIGASAELFSNELNEIRTAAYFKISLSFGAGSIYLLKTHFLPGIFQTIQYCFYTGLPNFLISITLLSYLGVPILEEWMGPGLGEQISFSKDYFDLNPTSLLAPVLLIIVILFSIQPKRSRQSIKP